MTPPVNRFVTVALLMGLGATLGAPSRASAAVITDASIASAATLSGPDFVVTETNGAIVGDTLYLSFDTLDVAMSETLTISSSSTVSHVVIRVTGGSPSSLNGAITVDVIGASLWLINPAGVQLGSSVAFTVTNDLVLSTADYVRASSGDRFQAPALGSETLADTPPRSLGFLTGDDGQIVGTDADITASGDLSLVAGSISLTGGTLDAVDVALVGATLGEYAVEERFVSFSGAGSVVVTGTVVREDEELFVSPAACGNGFVDPDSGEECDEGADNADNTPDACRLDCTSPACGDGILDVMAGEVCDDGGANSDTAADACRTSCVPAFCGDGALDTGELCDDGLDNSTAPDDCQPNCIYAVCGDGIVSADEECDDGDANSDTLANACRTDCQAPRCGDGILDDGEECDAAGMNSDGTPDACRTTCEIATCGDGVIDSNETCDDGLFNSDTRPDTCRADCGSRNEALVLLGGAVSSCTAAANPAGGQSFPWATLSIFALTFVFGLLRRRR